MKRKVIQLAGRTLVVSLPSQWARKYHIKKGDEMEVREDGKSISFGSEGKKEEGKLQLTLKGSPEFIKRRVNVAYKRGFDEIEASFDDSKIIKDIQEELGVLIGFEITYQSKNNVVIKNIAESIEDEFDAILRRVFLMLLELAEGSYETIKSKEYSKLTEIKTAEALNDRYTNLLKRILNKKGFTEPKTGNLLYCIIWEIEKLADQYENICNTLEKKGRQFNLSKEILSLFKETNELLRMFYELFYKFSEEKGDVFTRKYKELKVQSLRLLGQTTKEENRVVHYLDFLINRTYEIAGPYYAMQL